MNDISVLTFEQSIETIHGAKARLLARERVHEVVSGKPYWQGEVLIFELLDHPTARLCYAWEVAGEVTAVLGKWPINSPSAAVRAAIRSHGS